MIRTRRSPFFRSTPSVPLLLAAISVVLLGALLPATPLAHALGFAHLPGDLYLTITGLVLVYLGLMEVVKREFYRRSARRLRPQPIRRPGRRVARRASRFTSGSPYPGRKDAAGGDTALRAGAASLPRSLLDAALGLARSRPRDGRQALSAGPSRFTFSAGGGTSSKVTFRAQI